VARDADEARRLAFLVGVVQALVGQLHYDDQLALNDFDALVGEDEWVADFLDALEGLELLLGAHAFRIERVEIAVDEFDGFVKFTGRNALPNSAVASAAERLDELVAGNRLRAGLADETHGSPHGSAGLAVQTRKPPSASPRRHPGARNQPANGRAA